MIMPVLKQFVDSGESLRYATVVVANEYEKEAFEGAVELEGRQDTEGAE